jgi:hypothetical protein
MQAICQASLRVCLACTWPTIVSGPVPLPKNDNCPLSDLIRCIAVFLDFVDE